MKEDDKVMLCMALFHCCFGSEKKFGDGSQALVWTLSSSSDYIIALESPPAS